MARINYEERFSQPNDQLTKTNDPFHFRGEKSICFAMAETNGFQLVMLRSYRA